MKLPRFISTVILTGIVLFLTTQGIPSFSQSRPEAAIVDTVSGIIRKSTCADCPTSRLTQGNQLTADSTILFVSATQPGGDEHWAHLRFISRSSRNIALVQAGTAPRYTRYRFPCSLGRGTGVWGLSGGTTPCSSITVSSPGWQSRVSAPSLAQKAHSKTDDTLVAQQDPAQLVVTAANRLSVIYIDQLADRTIVNVLAGSATIRGASSSLIVRAGVRYIDYGDGDRGDTEPIPENVYTARPVQIFLDPANWSDDLETQVIAFERAVEETRATVDPPPPSDPEPVYVPEPFDWDIDLFPNGSDDEDEPEDQPPPTRDPDGGNTYPQRPQAPETAPPVSDDILDGIPSEVYTDDPLIDYGNTTQPPPDPDRPPRVN